MTHRVLVVENHEQWRRQISSALQEQPHWEVIGEASDGPEAVQKAHDLKPDLILLDIGLQTMNGIEAAGRILADDPAARILFVSEHRSLDIVQAAVGTGARGYLLKSDLGTELQHAMEAVVKGKRFISPRLGGRVGGDAKRPRETHRHEVAFYSDDEPLLDGYERFCQSSFDEGKSLIVLVTGAHQSQLRARLEARGIDVGRAIREGRYFPLDIGAALSEFMVDGWIDEARFWLAAACLIMGAAFTPAGERVPVAACGECAPRLLKEENAGAAVRLEQLWDELSKTYDVEVFCGYLQDAPHLGEESPIFQQICAAHSAVHRR